MPFDKGTITFRICRLDEELPADALERFKSLAAQSLDMLNDEPMWGWVSPRHLLDCNLTEDNIKTAGYYHLCLRQAEKKIPASLLNAECRLEELSRMAANNTNHISKKERKAIKEEVTAHLLPQMPPQLSGTYFTVDNAEKLLFTTAVSQHSLDIFLGMFSKTFGYEPIPLTPEYVASNMYGISADDVPSICISPALKQPDGEINGTLGENFLTWLWYYQEARGGVLPPSKLGEFAMMIDGPLTFKAEEGNGAVESVVRKGTPTISAEAKAALMVGKKLKSAKFIIARDKQEWSCTLDANEFIFRGLKLPEGEALEPAAVFEERMTNLFIFHSVFFGLFEKFLNEMTTAEKLAEYKKKAQEWISNRQEV